MPWCVVCSPSEPVVAPAILTFSAMASVSPPSEPNLYSVVATTVNSPVNSPLSSLLAVTLSTVKAGLFVLLVETLRVIIETVSFVIFSASDAGDTRKVISSV